MCWSKTRCLFYYHLISCHCTFSPLPRACSSEYHSDRTRPRVSSSASAVHQPDWWCFSLWCFLSTVWTLGKRTADYTHLFFPLCFFHVFMFVIQHLEMLLYGASSDSWCSLPLQRWRFHCRAVARERKPMAAASPWPLPLFSPPSFCSRPYCLTSCTCKPGPRVHPAAVSVCCVCMCIHIWLAAF